MHIALGVNSTCCLNQIVVSFCYFQAIPITVKTFFFFFFFCWKRSKNKKKSKRYECTCALNCLSISTNAIFSSEKEYLTFLPIDVYIFRVGGGKNEADGSRYYWCDTLTASLSLPLFTCLFLSLSLYIFIFICAARFGAEIRRWRRPNRFYNEWRMVPNRWVC